MSCNRKEKVDLIVSNATIYSVNSEFGTYQSMAIANGKIVGIGTNKEIANGFDPKEIIDLQGAPVYPGFIDPHCHFLGYGEVLANANLKGASSWAEAVAHLVEHQKNYPTSWTLGRGWNQNEWDVKEFPSNELLNKAFPNKPVLLIRIDGHAAMANNAALRLAGIDENTRVEGGEIGLFKGKPTGLLVDNAIDLVRKFVPAYSLREKENALLKAQENCFAVGLTSVGDAGLDLAEVLLIDSLQKSGKLSMKVNAMLSPTDENFNHFLKNGLYSTPHLTVRTIKLYADGALGSRGALLLEPYSDSPETKGLQLETTQRLTEVCQRAYEAGYQVATHCIGDAAVRLMLNVYGQFLQPGNDNRWRIEHAQTVHPTDLPRFGQLAVIPSIQTTHATSDMFWAVNRLGSRISNAYIYKDLLEQNRWLPNGSDFPIEEINPLYGFYAAVSRRNLNGEPSQGFQMENALTRQQALRAATIWAAKAAFEENHKGSLEVGKDADFVVLSDDIMVVPEDTLPQVKVLQTFIFGKNVFLKN
jgi:hypothetical protein